MAARCAQRHDGEIATNADLVLVLVIKGPLWEHRDRTARCPYL
jgi:hypothetical protein